MLPVAEAQARILAHLTPMPTEWVTLQQGLGRVLATDLQARRDHPPTAVSAMDGYAVRASDTAEIGRAFQLVGEVAAGGDRPLGVGPNETVRIFTGGAVPPGADAIVIQENAEADGDVIRFSVAVASGTFVRPAGLDFPAGWTGLAAGTVLDARALGLAAAMGHLWLSVRRRPRIGLLATGNELRWPGEMLHDSQITSSNTVAVGAMAIGWGGLTVDLGISPDDGTALAARLREAAGLDLLVTTGGASVGDYDLVQQALGREGLTLDFWKIAMRPGKPLLFGQLGAVPVLGFPGNPVSTGVCAIVFLRMALQKMLGLPPKLPQRHGRLANPLAANDVRQDYLRGRYVDLDGERRIETAARQDSSMQATFAAADALVVRAALDPAREAGDMVTLIDLREALDSLR
jgi:molybdopterin molybdotransferase